MRRTLTGINFELAAAVRRVNAALDRIPEDRRPGLSGESWHSLEREPDRACGVGRSRGGDAGDRQTGTTMSGWTSAAELDASATGCDREGNLSRDPDRDRLRDRRHP